MFAAIMTTIVMSLTCKKKKKNLFSVLQRCEICPGVTVSARCCAARSDERAGGEAEQQRKKCGP